jgi:hypothetical protein
LGCGTTLILVIVAGCATVRVTDPPRTATEQYLISQAAIKAIDQLASQSLRDRTVYVDYQYLTAATQPSDGRGFVYTYPSDDAMFVVGELRAKLLLNGVRLCDDRSKAQVILEVRSGALGIDRQDSLIGLPSFAFSTNGATGASVPFATPEISIVKTQKQWGYANVAFVAYWNDTGEVIASSGPFIGTTSREDFWFLGAGPKTVGNIPPAQR